MIPKKQPANLQSEQASKAPTLEAAAREDRLFIERFHDVAPQAAHDLATLHQRLTAGEPLGSVATKLDRETWQAFYRASDGLPLANRSYWAALLLRKEAPLMAAAAVESALSLEHPKTKALLRFSLGLQRAHGFSVPLGSVKRIALDTQGVQILPSNEPKREQVKVIRTGPAEAASWTAYFDVPGSVLLGFAPAASVEYMLAPIPFPEYDRRKPPELWTIAARRWLPLDGEQFLLMGTYWKRKGDLLARLEAALNAGGDAQVSSTGRRLVELGAMPSALDAVEQWLIAADSPGDLELTDAAEKVRQWGSIL